MFLHRGLSLLCGGVAEHPRAVRAELCFISIDGGFCLMVDRQLRVCRRISRFGRAFCRADVGIGPYKKIVGVLANTDDFVFSLHYR